MVVAPSKRRLVRKAGANPVFPTYTGLVLVAATLIVMTLAALQESRVLGFIAGLLAVGTLVLAGMASLQMGEWGPVLTGYLGLIMLGAVFLAIGLLASGLTRNQIIAWVSTAAVLDISVWTVSTHLRRVFAKFAVNSRAALVAKMIRQRML